MISLTAQERSELIKAVRTALQSMKDTEAILARVGKRLKLEWKEGAKNVVRVYVDFVDETNIDSLPDDLIAQRFANEKHWRQQPR